MVDALLTRPMTLVVRQASGTDDYGSDTYSEERTDVVGELQQEERDEPGPGGEFSDSQWQLFLPVDLAGLADTASAVEVDGHRYEFVGQPWPVWSPRRNSFSHLEATVRLAGG